MRAELEELKKSMEDSMAQQREQQETAEEPPPSLELEFDVSVDETGETKRISDLDTRQVIMTITARQKDKTLEEGGGFVMTNDMWLAPSQAAAQEITDFFMQYAQAVYGEALGIDPPAPPPPPPPAATTSPPPPNRSRTPPPTPTRPPPPPKHTPRRHSPTPRDPPPAEPNRRPTRPRWTGR